LWAWNRSILPQAIITALSSCPPVMHMPSNIPKRTSHLYIERWGGIELPSPLAYCSMKGILVII
jgi:hypothetical protein